MHLNCQDMNKVLLVAVMCLSLNLGIASNVIPECGVMIENEAHSYNSEGNASSVICNDGVLHVYRLALPVSYKCFHADFRGDVNSVRTWWGNTVDYLNRIFTPDLGVFFELVDDERLIITDPNAQPTSSNSLTIVDQGTSIINSLIGEDAYDIGMIIANSSDVGGRAMMNSAYRKIVKGASTCRPMLVDMAHELGHMFGSKHVQANTTGTSYYSEPGNGQSVMGYGDKLPFFSAVSIEDIRSVRCSGQIPVIDYNDVTDTTFYSQGGVGYYNNIVRGIATRNGAPEIDTTDLKRRYRVPVGTYIHFDIKAKDPDGDCLSYGVHQFDVTNVASQSNARFRCDKPSAGSDVCFKPSWRLMWDGSADKLVKNDYSDAVEEPGVYKFLIFVSDGVVPDSGAESLTAVNYDSYLSEVEFVSGTPFRISSVTPALSGTMSYPMGQRLKLKWKVDDAVFGKDSRVRVSLSDDFGTSFKYVLKESAPNTGECDVILPQIAIGQVDYLESGIRPYAGVIRVEEIGGVACAFTAVEPFVDRGSSQIASGGFKLVSSPITFADVPERYVESEKGQLPPVADVKAYSGGVQLPVTFSETRDEYSVSRIWKACNSSGKEAEFEQIIRLAAQSAALTPVENDGQIKVTAVSDGVAIEAPDGTECRLFDVAGRIVFDGKILSGTRLVSLLPGLYIVKAGRHVYKVKVAKM